jgi:hypothetical protein
MTVSFSSLVWIEIGIKRAQLYSFYTSPPGLLRLVILSVVGIRFNIFAFAVLRKLKRCFEFYRYLRVFGTMYILIRPFVVLISTQLPFQNQSKVIELLTYFAALQTQLIFLIWLDPRSCTDEFPFHAYSSEISYPDRNGDRSPQGSSSKSVSYELLDNRIQSKRSIILPITSISGGTASIRDENGKIRVENPFDKMHIGRLKSLSQVY